MSQAYAKAPPSTPEKKMNFNFLRMNQQFEEACIWTLFRDLKKFDILKFPTNIIFTRRIKTRTVYLDEEEDTIRELPRRLMRAVWSFISGVWLEESVSNSKR